MAIKKIRKRDGSLVDFDSTKIHSAVQRAIVAVRGKSNGEVDGITVKIIEKIAEVYPDGVTDVESVQDVVEQTLMREGYFDVAKAYILYRERHSEIRNERRGEIR